MKNYLILVGTHPTAGSVFKFFKNYESPYDDCFAVSPLDENRYEHCMLKEWENQLCECGEGFKFFFYRVVDEITPEALITLKSDFSLALQNPNHKVINGEVL